MFVWSFNQRERRTRSAPLPLVGRGWGVGVVRFLRGGAIITSPHHPPPHPSPTAGCGLARFRQILKCDQTPASRGLVGGREQTEFDARADSTHTNTLQLVGGGSRSVHLLARGGVKEGAGDAAPAAAR